MPLLFISVPTHTLGLPPYLRDMHTTVHTEVYSNCLFNSTHHQGLKEQICHKISPAHSAVIFNSDKKKLYHLESLKSSPLSDIPTSGISVQKTSRIRSHQNLMQESIALTDRQHTANWSLLEHHCLLAWHGCFASTS